eukprot:1397638-Ditylum_brightwellii.AAC.1
MEHSNFLVATDSSAGDTDVGIHCSANMYAYGSTKDIRYRNYVHWKITGIPNPEFWSFTVKPAQALEPG